MSEHLVLAPLEEARWTVTALGDLLGDVLDRAAADEAQWQGIAYTTARAHALRSATPEILRSTDGEDVPLDTVYELRLWAVDGLPAGVLAKELRWVNGVGSVEVRTAAQTEAPSAEPCWYRNNSYLQHGASAPYRENDEMPSIEIFTAEKKYGNVVFTDELMTGRWN